jgi:hypothetical protein
MRERVKKELSDVEMLLAWCHWKLKEPGLFEDDRELVMAVQNVCSQVGTWKAKYEREVAKSLATATFKDKS